MREEITSEWARKTAESILGEKINKQIQQCLDNIELAVKRNEFSCSVNVYADALTIKELNKRGFTCKHCDGDQRDPSYLLISW